MNTQLEVETLTTDRLVLRSLVRQDAKRFSKLAGIYSVASMTGSFPSPFDERSVEGLIDIFRARAVTGKAYHWAITLNDQLIGVVGLHNKDDRWDLGYWLGKPYWGAGYASEAISFVITHLKNNYNDKPIEAVVFTDNPASARLLNRLGFIKQSGLGQGYSVARNAHHPIETFLLPVETGSSSSESLAKCGTLAALADPA